MQIPVCWGRDDAECAAPAGRSSLGRRRLEGDGRVVQPVSFDVYSQFVREEDIAPMIPCVPGQRGLHRVSSSLSPPASIASTSCRSATARRSSASFIKASWSQTLREL